MLLGQEFRKISKKHQVALPMRIRAELGDRLIVTKGIESCLQIVSPKNWEILLEGTEGKPFLDKTTRELHRFLFGNAVELVLDKQGRMILPDYLVTYAKIKSQVVFIGIQRYVEVWDTDEFKKHEDKIGNIELLTISLSQTKGHE